MKTPPPPRGPALLSVTLAEDLLGVSNETVRNLVRRGELVRFPVETRPGERPPWIITRKSVDALLAARSARQSGPSSQ